MSPVLAFSGNLIFGMELMTMIKILVTLFSAALFLQSGFDKVINWSGNRDYINGMFEKTILPPFVPLLMPVITAVEVAAGLFSLNGALWLILGGRETTAVLGLLLGAKAILLLFFWFANSKRIRYGSGADALFYIFYRGIAVVYFLERKFPDGQRSDGFFKPFMSRSIVPWSVFRASGFVWR